MKPMLIMKTKCINVNFAIELLSIMHIKFIKKVAQKSILVKKLDKDKQVMNIRKDLKVKENLLINKVILLLRVFKVKKIMRIRYNRIKKIILLKKVKKLI